MNVFLLMGQSNMSGRGRLADVPALVHPDVFMWRDGQWLPAAEPLHTDKPDDCGVGLGMSFAVDLAQRMGLAPVGLVPCAVGGSPLRRWMPGADLYEAVLGEARAALAHGSLSGLLWHQGEHDSCGEEMASSYADRLATMITQLRTDLAVTEDVPFIAGELGPFLKAFPQTVHYEQVNRALRDLGNVVPHYQFVRAEGLEDNGDALHFNAKSLRAFGQRYARAFEKSKDG